MIEYWAEERPAAPVLQAGDGAPLTYSGLAAEMARIRACMNSHGLGRGDRIGVIHSDNAGMFRATLGVMSGATAVPLNPNFQKIEFAAHLERSGLKAVLIQNGLETTARNAAAAAGIPCLPLEDSILESSNSGAAVPDAYVASPVAALTDCDDVAFVSSTSGTTTRCKVFALDWQKVLAHCGSCSMHFELRPSDALLQFRPLYYCGPIFTCLIALFSGGSLLIRSRFDADKALHDLIEHKVTWLHCGPTYLKALLERARSYPKDSLRTSLRFIRTGTGHTPSSVLDELEDLFGAPVFETYSTSEAGPISSNIPRPDRSKKGTVGIPHEENVKIRGVDGSFQQAGQVGEIVVRGRRVIDAYEQDPRANALAFVDGWFRTGDEGVIDEDGFLRLTGRMREIINRGGEKVSPSEVDSILLMHPSVQEAAIFPFSHPTLVEEVAAVVVLKPGETATELELIDFAFEKLASFKVPKKIFFSRSIPRSEDGKISRRELAAAFGMGDDDSET
jgi:acyl-CoA synthetase (AMP-forming)/AMP-acid ligase II